MAPRENHQVTPVFGLTKAELQPIVEEAVGEKVASFDISMDHPRPEPYGFAAEKEIPTFSYVTATGSTGRITIFVKMPYQGCRPESQQYRFLHAHQAPVPRMYGALTDFAGQEVLFIEHVETPRPVGTMREFLSLIARFHAIRPSAEYTDWLERESWNFASRFTGFEPMLSLIWDHARHGDLGEPMKDFCSSRVRLRQVWSAVRQVIERTMQMPRGLIHTDFSRENTGRRAESEMVVFDVEKVTLGPRFFDAAGSLAWPPQRWGPDLRQRDLGQHYLDEYARWGGDPPSLRVFYDEIRLVWFADKLRYFDWNLTRGLPGSVAGSDERRACCDELYRNVTALVAQYLLRGTGCSVLDR